MHISTIFLLFGILSQQFIEGFHIYPNKPCCYNQKIRNKRQIETNFEPNHLSPLPGTITIANNNNSQQNGETIPPNHLHWNIPNAANKGKDMIETDIVGIGGGLAHLRALAAQANARAAIARVRARARLHRPLLLEPTPEEFLHDDDSQQNNFPGPDSILSLKSIKRKLDPVPQQKFEPPQEIVPEDLSSKEAHGDGLSFLEFQPTHMYQQRPNIDEDNPNLQMRTAENYGNNYFPPPPPIGNYNLQPEIRVHNIDNSEEVYQNRKPGFSIIPNNWKPPPDSNLYVQGDYEERNGQEPVLAVLPGKWTDDDGYDTYYYEDYDVTPITYNIPEEGGYERSADSDKSNIIATIPEQFHGIKKQLRGWEKNPMIWRPDSKKSDQQRSADPLDKRHFHHSHSHIFAHKHVGPEFSSGFQGHGSGFGKPKGFSHSQNSGFFEHQIPDQIPIQHSSSFGHKTGFSHELSHGHGSITINNQKTMVVLPPGSSNKNVEIAQVTGTNNAVSQSQASGHVVHHQGGVLGGGGNGFGHSNFQSAQVFGNTNSVSQSQASGHVVHHQGGSFGGGDNGFGHSKFQSAQVFGNTNSVSQSQRSNEKENFLGSPYLIYVPHREANIWRTHNDFPQKFLRKRRSIDDNNLYNSLKNGSKFNKKILNVLKNQNEILNEIRRSAKDDQDLLFITELGSNLIDNFEESLKSNSITKRSVPLLRLIADPNAKLDVPKSLENIGTVARNSFENKRAPMYHLKNLVGSAKDAFLSTLRIVPQDFLIPSQYKIINREQEGLEQVKLQASKRNNKEEVRAISPSLSPRGRLLRKRIKENRNPPQEATVRQPETLRESENLPDTFTKIGSMFRESVRSGQEALNHMGELYHSTRKALATARHSAPRVMLSSMRIPAVQRHQPLLPQNDKILMITPKILQLKQEHIETPRFSETNNDVVGFGNVMNSLGISNPKAEKVGRRRIIFQPEPLPQPILPNLQARSNFVEDIQRPTFNTESLRRYFLMADNLEEDSSEGSMEETMDALNNAREVVGASSLKDFVSQMKDGLSSLFKDKLEEAKDKLGIAIKKANYQKVKDKITLESEGGKNPVSLKFKATNSLGQDVKPIRNEEVLEKNNQNETVGAGLALSKNLLTPFMGQPSKTERRQFFEELGDTEELNEENNEDEDKDSFSNDHQEVIGGINPIIFNKTFELCDNRSPFEILAALNASRFKNYTDGVTEDSETKDDDRSETWAHKCIYRKPTTIPDDVETTTKMNFETTSSRIEIEESTTKKNIEESLEEEDHSSTIRIEEENTTKNTVKAPESDDVGTSMTMGKHLLTPFMGKPVKKEMISYFEPYVDGYEEDADSDEDGYLGSPEQLQVLPNDGTKKNDNKGSFTRIAEELQNGLSDLLELNHV